MAEGLPDDASYGAGLPPPGNAPDGGLSTVAFLVEVIVVDAFEDRFVGCSSLPDEYFLLGYFSHHEAVVGLSPIFFILVISTILQLFC